MNTEKENKTVYFLGAGFTKEAGIPLQSKLLKETLENGGDDKLREFLKETFSFEEPSLTSIKKDERHKFYPTLEDVFSIIDIAIKNEEYVGRFKFDELQYVREKLMIEIIKTIDSSYKMGETDYISNFAKYLTGERIRSDPGGDPFAIISANWDVALINALRVEFSKIYKELFNNSRDKIKKQEDLIDIIKNKRIPMIDYCIYTEPIKIRNDSNSIHIPSTKIKAYGFCNVKYIALHGHAHFLFCPRCFRIFSPPSFEPDLDINDYTKLFISQYLKGKKCKYCKEKSKISRKEDIPTYNPVLIMPTYIRAFKNRHYYAIWQNAAIELQEADKIVFIGYSLPQSDFYIRHLLLTNLNKKAEIEIVTECDKGLKYEKCKNYVQLFGNRILEENIYHEGACKYIKRLTKNSSMVCW